MALDKAATVAHYIRLAEEAAKSHVEPLPTKGGQLRLVLRAEKEAVKAVIGANGAHRSCIECRSKGDGQGVCTYSSRKQGVGRCDSDIVHLVGK